MKPQPSDWLSPLARNAWFNLYEFHARRGTWDPLYLRFAEATAVMCARYVEFALECRALPDDAPSRGLYEEILEETRHLARQSLVEWVLIAPERLRVSAVNDDGLDADIARLCEAATEH